MPMPTALTEPAIRALERYVGVPYELGAFDCWDLAARVLREVFAVHVALPTDRARPAGAAGQRREIASLREEVATRVDVPFDGCGALFVEQGGLWHIGVVALHQGEVWVLHNSAKLGSAHLQRLSDLQRFGLQLEGWYAWK